MQIGHEGVEICIRAGFLRTEKQRGDMCTLEGGVNLARTHAHGDANSWTVLRATWALRDLDHPGLENVDL